MPYYEHDDCDVCNGEHEKNNNIVHAISSLSLPSSTSPPYDEHHHKYRLYIKVIIFT